MDKKLWLMQNHNCKYHAALLTYPCNLKRGDYYMTELLDMRVVQRLKQRISQYETLLFRRDELDRQLKEIAEELRLSRALTPVPKQQRSAMAANRARSLTMKRYWAEKRKKLTRPFHKTPPKFNGSKMVQANRGISKHQTAASNRARSLTMKRYWAVKRGAAQAS